MYIGYKQDIILIPSAKSRIRVDVFQVKQQYHVQVEQNGYMVSAYGSHKIETVDNAIARLQEIMRNKS